MWVGVLVCVIWESVDKEIETKPVNDGMWVITITIIIIMLSMKCVYNIEVLLLLLLSVILLKEKESKRVLYENSYWE